MHKWFRVLSNIPRRLKKNLLSNRMKFAWQSLSNIFLFSSTCLVNVLYNFIGLFTMYCKWRRSYWYLQKEMACLEHYMFVCSLTLYFQHPNVLFKEGHWAIWGKNNIFDEFCLAHFIYFDYKIGYKVCECLWCCLPTFHKGRIHNLICMLAK